MFLKKLQNLPLRTRKIILWAMVISLSLVLFSWWVKNVPKRLESFKGEEFMEKLNFPKSKFGELIKNAEEISTTTKTE